MSTRRLGLLVGIAAAGVIMGCGSGDSELFDDNGGGATGGTGATSGTGATGGTAATSGTGATGGSATGGSGATGGSAGTGGSGGASQVVGCGTTSCDLSQSFCCLYLTSPATCLANGTDCTQGTDVLCDGPEDCPGQECCGQLIELNGQNLYNQIRCLPACDLQQAEIEVCGQHPSSCDSGSTCQPSQIVDYNVCIPN